MNEIMKKYWITTKFLKIVKNSLEFLFCLFVLEFIRFFLISDGYDKTLYQSFSILTVSK